MKKNDKLLIPALLLAFTLPLAAQAQMSTNPVDAAPPAQAMQSEQDPEVTYITGGVGETGLQHFKGIETAYNLKALFAEKNGEYLASVNVRITDAKGKVVLDTVTEGPYLLARLKPGKYTVAATFDGATKEQKVVLKDKITREYSFAFDSAAD
jgi:glucose/arabinose dehydrogenase